MRQRRLRFLPLAGVLAAAMWLVAFVGFGSDRPDGADASPDDLLAYYLDVGEGLQMAIFAALVGSVFFVLFLGCLRARLQRAEGDDGPLSGAVFAAGIVVAVGQFAVYASDFDGGGDAGSLSPTTAEAYYFLGDLWFVGAGLMAGLLVITTGVVAVRAGALPRWFGWVSIGVGILLLLPPTLPVMMFFAFPTWVAVTGAVLATGRSQTPAAEAVSAAGSPR